MTSKNILIRSGILKGDELNNQIAIVTGGGSGIGFEACRSLAWLGCKVIIAEIDETSGKNAEKTINDEIGREVAKYYNVDIGNEKSIKDFTSLNNQKYKSVDIILNNATIAPIGKVLEVSLEEWDASYNVNLRGPIILIKELLPNMMKFNRGVIVCVSSSGVAPYMGAYEIFKMSQIELANTLVSELENTNIQTFTIGPGLVRTPGALRAIEKLAPLYSKTVEEFFKMSENQIISVEEAGAGFAAAIALASRYNGQEIGSIQALYDAGITFKEQSGNSKNIEHDTIKKIYEVSKSVYNVLVDQNEGWKNRPMFERMWVYRDFTKHAGMSVDQWIDSLTRLTQYCESNNIEEISSFKAPFNKLVAYIQHLQKLSKGYFKDMDELKKSLIYLEEWEKKATNLEELMKVK